MNLSTLFPIILTAVIVVILLIVIASGYVKASPDEAIIISGPRKTPKILIGRAGIKIPFLERKDKLILKQMTVDIKTNGFVPTLDFIGVDIDAVAKVRIDTTEEGVQKAMKNFLNMDEEEIISALTDSLQGNMREIIGTVELRELNTDRKKFGDQVQEKAQSDMNALGIHIISCNIQRIEDEQGLINALGQDNMSKIQKDASIAKANADRDVAIAKAEANKAANDAMVLSETEIAQKQNELAIKKAELKREADDRQAIADAAYEIQKQAQEKSIQTAMVNAAIAKAEREAELRQKEVLVKQQELAANIEKTADAEKYRKEKEAEANLVQRQKEADARKYEQEKEAEAIRIKAEAAMYQKTKEAEGIAAVGRAEAEAIEAKGLAEAQAMEKKAEAYAKYNNAAVTEMIINQLPAIATAIASPISAIDKVTVIDSGSGDGKGGITSFGGVAPAMLKQTLESVKEVTGFDLLDVMKAQTYDAKVTKNINVTGLESKESKEVATEVLKDNVSKKNNGKKNDVVLDDIVE